MNNVFIEQLNSLLWIFREVWFGLGAASLLMGVAIYSAVKMRQEYRNVLVDIENANAILDKRTDAQDFTENFHIVNSGLKAIPSIDRSWEEFSKTLLPPLDLIDEPEYQVYRSTKRAADYFDIEHISSKIKPFIDSESLIGFGLVFTFIGLVAALINAGFNLGDTSNTQKTVIVIKELLSTAGAKFFASIGGVGGALIQTITMNSLRSRIDDRLKYFNDRLEGFLTFASLERIAADQYGYAKRQAERMEAMGTEIALAIGGKIENAMREMPQLMGTALTGAMEPVSKKLDEMANGVRDDNGDALRSMVEDFRTQIQGAGEQTMQQVVTQLDSLSTTLNQTVGNLAQSNNEIRSSLQEMMGSLAATSQTFGTSVEASANAASDGLRVILEELQQQQVASTNSMTALLTRLEAAGDQAGEGVARGVAGAMEGILAEARDTSASISESVASGLGEVTTALARINVEIERHQTGLQQVNAQIQNSASAMGGAAETIRTSTQPLSQVTVQLTAATDAVGRTVQQTNEASKNIAKAISDLLENWERQSSQLRGADEALEGAFKEITRNLTLSLAELEKFTKGVEVSFGGALQNLSAIVGELSEALEDANSGTKK